MTYKRYIIIKPNGKIFKTYNGQELYFDDRKRAEKVAVSWGKVKEVEITVAA
jgi:hypothetical protein